jgi:RNA recognition motif-containing protein
MGTRLFVGSLAYDVTEDQLKEAFAAAGNVDSVKIITDRDSGQSKGFGFVEMGSDDEAQKAIKELNGKDLGGRSLTVNEARPMTDRGGSGGGRRY